MLTVTYIRQDGCTIKLIGKQTDDKLKKAFEIAKRVHQGQVYKHPDGNKDYFGYHVINVYNRLADPRSDGDAEIVAILHDVLEDCKPEERKTLAAKIRDTFGEYTGLTLLFLDRGNASAEGITRYQEYIERVAANELAAFVKVHDLQENLLHCLLLNASDYAKNKLLPRYIKALNFLLNNK
jgi:hypothetical protein